MSTGSFRRKAIALILLLAVLLPSWVLLQRSLDTRRDRWPDTYPLLFLPSGAYLRATSLGYPTVLADALYLWSIQYYGHHRTAEGRQYLWHIFDVITELDPRYIDAYLTGALIMAVDMIDADNAIRLLDKGFANNPGEWILPLDAGFYSFIDLEDYERAASYFEMALAVPGVPDIVERLRAGMYEYLGDLETALGFWADIHDSAEDDRIRSIAWQHVYDIRVELDLELLRDAVLRFREEHGQPPAELAALARAGYLDRLPSTPEGEPYSYDPKSAMVADPREQQDRRGRSL